MSLKLYWGDLHSHCSISYGHGSVEQALLRARAQLDFCSITGHAFWPDMPIDRTIYGEIIDYHSVGFDRLARNWQLLLDAQSACNRTGHFLAFPSYEWHSLEYGDHNIYGSAANLPLQDAHDLTALRSKVRDVGAIAIPHHIGYAAGYRGIDWDHFRDQQSPFVEVFSLHGCSVSENSPYPMLHDMGPRDAGSTAEHGWSRGYRFGIVGGTDHHGAYPGSHGDGRMGVFATELTREALWQAFWDRRVFAATGDRIDARFFVDDAWMGSEVRSSQSRDVKVDVRGTDSLQLVELLKNGRVIRRFFPDAAASVESPQRFRLRVSWGWGRKDAIVEWQSRLSVSDGVITRVETCFSGQPIVAPTDQIGDEEIPDNEDLPHAVIDRTDKTCHWRSITKGNPTMRHQTTQAISFEIEASRTARFRFEVNGQRYDHELGELLNGGRTHYLQGWLSEAMRVGPLVPLEQCHVQAVVRDEPEEDVDIYRLQVAQHNGQWAWLSPIWVER